MPIHILLFSNILSYHSLGRLRGQCVCLQCGRLGFNSWVGKIPWRRKWQPTPVLLPGKSYGRRSLVGYSPWGCKKLDTTEWLHFHFSFHSQRDWQCMDWATQFKSSPGSSLVEEAAERLPWAAESDRFLLSRGSANHMLCHFEQVAWPLWASRISTVTQKLFFTVY